MMYYNHRKTIYESLISLFGQFEKRNIQDYFIKIKISIILE